MNETLPRAWIVHSIERLPPLASPQRGAEIDDRTRRLLKSGSDERNFRHRAIVESDERIRVPQLKHALLSDEEPCAITRYEPTRVTLEATLAQPGLLVLSDMYYPGWQATVRTQPQPGFPSTRVVATPIVRTNRVMRGVFLPAGKHTVEYRFQPQRFAIGATISGLSWLALGAFAVMFVVRRDSRQTPAHPKTQIE